MHAQMLFLIVYAMCYLLTNISSDSAVAKNLKNSKKCSKTSNESTTTESKHSLTSFKYEDNSDNIFSHKKKGFKISSLNIQHLLP